MCSIFYIMCIACIADYNGNSRRCAKYVGDSSISETLHK